MRAVATAPGTLTSQEQRELLEITARDPKALRDHMMLAFALGTGLRLHELLALDVGDVVQASFASPQPES